jgi:hypothetical protein
VAYLDGFGRKTFLYDDDRGALRVVNGTISKTDGGYRVSSHAPYPHEYHYRDKGIHLVLPNPTPSVVVAEGTVIPEGGR